MVAQDKGKSRINPEMLVGVSAVFIGVCALVVSLYETSLMRKEQRAEVMPLLELSRSFDINTDDTSSAESRIWLQAENVGLGPARVSDVTVTVDGKPQATWGAAIRELAGEEIPVTYSQSTINGRTIPPERSVTMMDLQDTELTNLLLTEFERLDFDVCYCSIFEECWTTSYSTLGTAKPVEQCQPSNHSFTE